MKEVFDLAYQFRDSKIWKSICEEELFAVRLPDGTIGYCCITGKFGEHLSVTVYPGAKALSTYRRVHEVDLSVAGPSEMLIQDCIQCSLERREELTPDEIKALRVYCKEAKIPFRGPFPQFARYCPNCVPWHVKETADWDAIHAALKVAVALAKRDKSELGLRPIGIDTQGEEYIPDDDEFLAELDRLFENIEEVEPEAVTVPLYFFEDNELRIDRISLPPFEEPVFAAPTHFNEVAIGRLNGLSQRGDLQCQVVRLPEPVEDDPPYLPAALMAVGENGMAHKPIIMKGVAYDPDEMLDGFIKCLIADEIYPERLLVRTPETMTLLREFGKRAKIKVVKRKRLDLVDEAIDNMLDYFAGDDDDGMRDQEEMDEILQLLGEMSVPQLRMVPAGFLKELLDSDLLPDDIAAKVRKALRK